MTAPSKKLPNRTFKLDSADWSAFTQVALHRGMNRSDLLRDMIRRDHAAMCEEIAANAAAGDETS